MLQVYQVLFLCPKKGKPGSFSPKKATRVGTSLPKLAIEKTAQPTKKAQQQQQQQQANGIGKHRQKQSASIDEKAARTVWCAFKSAQTVWAVHTNKLNTHNKPRDYYLLLISIDIDKTKRPVRTYRPVPCYFTTYYHAHTL